MPSLRRDVRRSMQVPMRPCCLRNNAIPHVNALAIFETVAGNRKIFYGAGRSASRTIIGVSFRFESFVVIGQLIVVFVQVMAAETS